MHTDWSVEMRAATQRDLDKTGIRALPEDLSAIWLTLDTPTPSRSGKTTQIVTSKELVAIINEYGTAMWVSPSIEVGSTQQIDDHDPPRPVGVLCEEFAHLGGLLLTAKMAKGG